MRITAILIASMVISATALASQTSTKYREVSRDLVSQAMSALSGDEADRARELFERALVADPSNIEAMVGIAKTHDAAGHTGRSLKFYRQALVMEPNAKDVLALQARAFLKRDMLDRAQDNRDKVARICADGCQALTDIDSAIAGYKDTQARQMADKSDETQG